MVCSGTQLLELDPYSGVIHQTFPLPGSFPSTMLNCVYDPWTDLAVVSERVACATRLRAIPLHSWSGGAWPVVHDSPFVLTVLYPWDTNTGMIFTNEQPFELFGHGCANGLGREPRLGWRGLARQGQSFDVTMRDGEPNALAMFLFGFDDQFWAPVGALPFDASALGAPGCKLFVGAAAQRAVFLDSAGHGTTTIRMPVNTALAGLELFAQAVSSSTGNTLGFASSEALVIRTR